MFRILGGLEQSGIFWEGGGTGLEVIRIYKSVSPDVSFFLYYQICNPFIFKLLYLLDRGVLHNEISVNIGLHTQ